MNEFEIKFLEKLNKLDDIEKVLIQTQIDVASLKTTNRIFSGIFTVIFTALLGVILK